MRYLALAVALMLAPLASDAALPGKEADWYRAPATISDVYADGTPVLIETTLSSQRGRGGFLSVRWLASGAVRESITEELPSGAYGFSDGGDHAWVSHAFEGTDLRWDASWVARDLMIPSTDLERRWSDAAAVVNAMHDSSARLERSLL